MPLDKFGYYSLVEPLQKDTTSGWKRKAQVLLEKLMAKYKDNLNYYSHLKSSEQTIAVDIITDLETLQKPTAGNERKWRFEFLCKEQDCI
jgi:hypothetical protein